MRPRHIAAVALVLGLTVAGFIVARAITEQDARRDSERRAEVAAALIRGRIEQATSLTESLRRFMYDAGGTGVTSDQFARNALRWLSPAEFPAAAWAEQVRAADRAAYERRLGQPIVTPDGRVVGRAPSFLPATLVSGFTPMDLSGVDLRREPGIAAALRRAIRPGGVAATPVTGARGRASGLFLVAAAPNLIDGVLRPGAVVVFVPEATLRGSASHPPGLRLVSAGRSSGAGAGGHTVRKDFFVAGRGFAVVIPEESVSGPAAVLPWIILAAGLVLSALAAGLGVNAGRRAKAQAEVDRIFTLSSDLVAVADFKGRFTRVNPAVEQILGYTQEQFLAKPYLELVHPDDRERTAAEAAAIARGKRTLSFENRYIHRDGSPRVIEWTATPVVEDGVMYAVGRDATERRQAKAELERLAGEQAALRRVATMVAQAMEPAEIFSAVSKEVGRLFGSDMAAVGRFDPDGPCHVVVGLAKSFEGISVGSRWELDDSMAVAAVYRTGRSARIDAVDWSTVTKPIGEAGRRLATATSVASPIVVEGRLWGAMNVSSKEPLPPGAEERLEKFTELVATAVANAESREALRQLAAEQAALRRVATLVAQAAPPLDVFAAVGREIGVLLSVDHAYVTRFDEDGAVTVVAGWVKTGEALPVALPHRFGPGPMSEIIRETGRPARLDPYPGDPGAVVIEEGVRSAVSVPITVEGRLWGFVCVTSTREEPPPPETEARLAGFTELMATAISNVEAREDLRLVAAEQAALRRVATLVAHGVGPEPVFRAVADEVDALFGPDISSIARFEADDTVTVMGAHGPPHERGARVRLDPRYVVASVRASGKAARFDTEDPGAEGMPDFVRELGLRSGVASPIVVDGELWGAITLASLSGPLLAGTERRLADFTELMATAISNTEAREDLRQVAEEQAALRRVAELVAREASQDEIFGAIAEELARVLGTEEMRILRYDGDREAVVVARTGSLDVFAVGNRFPLDGESVASRVFRTGQPARIDDYRMASGRIAEAVRSIGIRGVVGTPIVVRGRLWGTMVAGTPSEEPQPPDTELRLGQFTELMATAIANAEARAEVERLADEQAALRRVATLVAQGASPGAVLDAVATEMERVLGANGVTLSRYEPDEEVTVVAHSGADPRRVPPGTRVIHRGENVISLVRRTERSARMEHQAGTGGAIAELARRTGVRASVGAPIVVEGRLWGVAVANWTGEQSPPAGTEERMAKFAQLLDTAIANADSRDQLNASRARLLAAGDEARRRVVRDLHDGAQQRLVHTVVTLKLAQRALRQEDGKAKSLVGEALEQAERGNAELRELAHGILPSVLTRGGLAAGVRTVVERLEIPVQVDVPDDRFPAEIEASAYFIVAEALTNVVKHSHAESAGVTASVEDGLLRVFVRDDGIGGADHEGHGLVGLNDRAAALGGRLEIVSPPGGGTLVTATLPLGRSISERSAPRPRAAP